MVSFRYRPDVDAATPVTRSGTARIPTAHGAFTAHAFVDAAGLEHIAYVGKEPLTDTPLVRVHSECLTGDVLGSLRCDCGSQLQAALARVAADGGVLLYVRGHEGRGIGLSSKLQAYELQDTGLDTVDANHALGFPTDARTYDVAAAILADLGVTRIRLLSNNPLKVEGLSAHGIDVIEQVALLGRTTPENIRYLETKGRRMDHALDPVLETAGEETA